MSEDMFKKPNKKQLLLRRIIFSAIATIAVLIIATVSILFILGYRLDSGNGRLEQGALVQFDSAPSAADVWIDDTMISSRTATKATVLAGVHSFKMSKSGYEDWNRTLDLKAGTLTWLDYTRLVPVERKPVEVAKFATATAMTTSPDLKEILVQQQADQPVFTLVDISAEKIATRQIELPATIYSESTTENVTHSFALGSWNKGGRYTLVTHTYNDQTEWLVVDTQNVAQSINVSRLLSVTLADVQFAGNGGKLLYGLASDGNLRKLDLSGATISRGLVPQVESFAVYDANLVSYVGRSTTEPGTKVAGVYRDGDELPHVLRSAPETSALRISVGKYFGDDYVAIAEGSKVSILKGSYAMLNAPSTTNLNDIASLELPSDVTMLSFSPASAYVLAQAGAAFASYEIEHDRKATGSMRVPEGATASALRWLDTAYLMNDDGGTLVMRDFDNANSYDIMPVAPGFGSTLSQNGRFIYAMNKTDTGFQLQRVTMILQ